MPTDVEIVQAATAQPIAAIGATLGLTAHDLHPYGHTVAKVDLSVLDRPRPRPGPARLVLVSATTPTPAGEGKTTTSIGLADALHSLGASVCLALREPSLGPCMGMKGGATGGGQSQVLPMERINLHFTGDFHAITAAHNLLAATLDNHLHRGNALRIDPKRVVWPRVLDVNDRSLRHVMVGLGGPADGMARESGFDITAASEVMAMLCLADGIEDLRARIDRTLVAYTYDKQPVLAAQLGVTGAMLALLLDALQPNLVQTLEGTPALLHGGPFANIAHGCNSVLATRTAMHLADWTVTEAGFGFDLGAEKFFDIKCRSAGLTTAAVVLVTTVRALKMHGGKARRMLGQPDAGAVEAGLPNLDKHIDNVRTFGGTPVVAINRFSADTDEEIAVILARCAALGVRCAVTDHHARGGQGAIALARALMDEVAEDRADFRPLYDLSASVHDKLRAVARKMYGAAEVVLTEEARTDLAAIEHHGYAELPVCIAKIPGSLSDDPLLRGRPEGFDLHVRALKVQAGAGFLVALTGDIVRMPGLPRTPLALSIDVQDGRITGLA